MQRDGRRELRIFCAGDHNAFSSGGGHALPGAAARLFLRQLAHDAAAMAALRRVYADVVSSRTLLSVTDRAVLEQLEWRLSAGLLELVAIPRPPPLYPDVGPIAPAAPEAEAKPAPAEPVKPPGEVTDPRWSKPRIGVGETLQAKFTVAGFKGGEPAKVTISEIDAAGGVKKVATLSATVDVKDGDVKVDWKRTEDEAAADLAVDEEAADGAPLEYRFEVEAGGIKAAGTSGPLWLTHTVELELEAEDGAAVPDAADVTLWDVLGDDFQAKAEKGKAKFEKILVGPFKIQVGPPPPTLSKAKWSVDRVEVGAEVEGSFSYKRVQEDEEVLVQIFELDADGSATLVDQLTEKLSGTSGDHKFKWTRSADGANADVAQDEADGDSGPLDYRFEVSASGVHSPPRSGPLWLTHTVEIDLSHGTGGKAFDDGVALQLTGPDGVVHKATTSGGKVRFEGVVVGPMTLALAAPEGDA